MTIGKLIRDIVMENIVQGRIHCLHKTNHIIKYERLAVMSY